MTYKVLLADDHTIVREGLRRLLEDDKEMQVVGEAGDGHETLRMARKLLPDVVVMDLSMPGLDGIETTRMLAKETPRVNVLILTMHADRVYAMRLLQAGARGFVSKGTSGQELLSAIRKVATAKVYLPPALAETLPYRYANTDTLVNPLEALSDRELQILKGVAEGRTGREIAQDLHLSIKTVDTYRARVLDKLGLETNADLIRFALRHGVIENVW
jgi:two-component system, NarL family, invasion response regulator UvrY